MESDGSVLTGANVSQSFTIMNNDSSYTAKDVFIKLKVNSQEGLDDNLEKDELEVSLTLGGVTKRLFYDGDYTQGYPIGDLAYGDSFNGDLTVTINTAGEDTFEDNQAYNCTLYVYQQGANYPLHYSPPDELEFIVKT